MSSTVSAIKTLIVPAVISLILYLVSTYALLPLWYHYRARYSHYLPLDSISNRTSSLRERITNGIANLMFNPPWRRNGSNQAAVADATSDDGLSEDGEELGSVSGERHRQLALSAQSSRPDHTRRLSRDLEEGFMDDSDEEDEDNRG